MWVALQLAALDADPPAWVATEPGVFLDEGLKTLDARNLVTFGSRRPIADDRYRGGSGGAAALAGQAAFFWLLGPRPASARLLSLTAALALLAAVGRILPPGGRRAALLLLMLDPLFLVFARLGLLEIPWAALAAWAIAAARAEPRRAFVGGILFGAACLVKPAALFAGPAVWLAASRGAAVGLRTRIAAVAPLLGGSLLVVGLAFLWGDPAPGTPVLLGSGVAAVRHLVEVPQAALGALRWLLVENPVLYVAGVVGLAVAFLDGRATAADRRCASIAVAWLAAGLVAVVLAGFAVPPARYVVNLVVPLALGAGVLTRRLAESPRGWVRWGSAGLAVTAVVWSVLSGSLGPTHAAALSDARAEFHASGAVRARPAPALVTGLWAATISFGTEIPVLVTCASCRFPVPHGAEANVDVALRALGSGAERTRMLVVAARESGEVEGWTDLLGRLQREGAPLELSVVGRLDVSDRALIVLEVTRARR